jgi:ribosomal protein S18 acetylase RimI-like enzyme
VRALQLRDAREEDMELLARLDRHGIEDGLSPDSDAELEERKRQGIPSGFRIVLFELASEPVAYAILRSHEEGITLRQFFVVRSHRRRGIGRAAIALLRERQVPPPTRLTLEVRSANEVGLAFWRALGFHERTICMKSG